MPDNNQDLPYDDHAPLLGEVVPDPLEAVKGSVPERRGNLIYHEIELHSGPYVRTVARFCQVYRHSTQEYRHTSVELFHFKRPNQHAEFAVDRKFALDGAALEAFVAASQAIPRLQAIGEAANSVVVPITRLTRDPAPDDLQTIVSGLSTLLNSDHGLRAIAEGKLTTETLINLDAAAQQARYRRAAADLQAMMEDPNRDEQEYQKWFELHPWVFGTEYLRRIPARQIDIESKVDIVLLSEDTLRHPGFTDSASGGLATFDCVIANPPFSLKEWGQEVWVTDPWGRAAFGHPPDQYGDYAWVQHMVASMAPISGRMAVVLPQGALFRKGAEGRIRRGLLEADLIEAVIGLAPNLFFGTGLAGSILVLRRTKPAERHGKVLLIDASSLFRKGRAQNFLDDEHTNQIVAWYRAFDAVPARAAIATLKEIEVQDWTLNISRYVSAPLDDNIPPLPEAVAAFKDVLAACRAAEDHLREVLTRDGWLA